MNPESKVQALMEMFPQTKTNSSWQNLRFQARKFPEFIQEFLEFLKIGSSFLKNGPAFERFV